VCPEKRGGDAGSLRSRLIGREGHWGGTTVLRGAKKRNEREKKKKGAVYINLKRQRSSRGGRTLAVLFTWGLASGEVLILGDGQ